MSEENVESFKRGTEAYNRRDLDELLKTLDPEVEWHSALLIPFGGAATVSRGHDGVRVLLDEVMDLRNLFENAFTSLLLPFTRTHKNLPDEFWIL